MSFQFPLADLSPIDRKKLEELAAKLLNASKSFAENTNILHEKLKALLKASLNELGAEFQGTDSINIENIQKIFDNTIGQAQTSLSATIQNYYKEQLKTRDIFLFDGVVVDKFLQLLQSILEFQKQVEKDYPDLSKHIIKKLDKLLIAVIATNMPLLATLIQVTGILETIKNLLKPDNLLPKIKQWREDIKEMKGELGSVYEKAEKVSEISEKTNIAPIQIAELNLTNDKLKEVNNLVDIQVEKSSLIQIIEAVSSLPKSTEEIYEKISKIKNALQEISILSEGKALVDVVNKQLEEVKQELQNIPKLETTVFEKFTSCCKAADRLTNMLDKITKISAPLSVGKDIVKAITPVITKAIELVAPPSVLVAAKISTKIAKELGATNVIREIIQSLTTNNIVNLRGKG